jgi:hypothetical protein
MKRFDNFDLEEAHIEQEEMLNGGRISRHGWYYKDKAYLFWKLEFLSIEDAYQSGIVIWNTHKGEFPPHGEPEYNFPLNWFDKYHCKQIIKELHIELTEWEER